MDNIRRRMMCFLMVMVMIISALITTGCTDKKDDSDDSLKAADPMTAEEIEGDDSGGCIEDAEDLLN